MPHVIAQPCIGTKNAACVEVCPVDCIHSTDGADQYYIDPDQCIDCGVCVEVCPVAAVYFEDELPEQWAGFARINAAFFERAAGSSESSLVPGSDAGAAVGSR